MKEVLWMWARKQIYINSKNKKESGGFKYKSSQQNKNIQNQKVNLK